MFANKKRSDPLDTEVEIRNEISESLKGILAVINDYHYTLHTKSIIAMINKLTDEDLNEVFKQIVKVAPEDLKELLNYLTKEVDNDKNKLRLVIRSLAEDGKVSEKLLDKHANQLLNKELFSNDPNVIKNLNVVEVSLNLLALKFRVQKLLLDKINEKNIDLKVDLQIYNTDLDETTQKDELKLKEARKTSSKFDDYLIEYNIGVKRKYDTEELIFLMRKLISLSKKESKDLPEGFMEKYNQLVKRNEKVLGIIFRESKIDNDYSFHRVRIAGGIYNFAYFGENAFENEFDELPKLSSKPVIVFLHGMFLSWAAWRWLINILRKDFQLIIPDMNGYGDSDELIKYHNFDNFAEYIAKFITLLGINDYSVFGHSAGSFTLQQLLQRKDIHPTHAVLIASAPYVKLGFIIDQIINLNRVVESKETVVKYLIKIPKRVLFKLRARRKFYPKESKYNAILKSSPRTIAETAEHLILEYNISDLKIQTGAKVLIVSPQKDVLVKKKYTQKLHEVFVGSTLFKVKEAGHLDILKILPELYERQVLDFLEK